MMLLGCLLSSCAAMPMVKGTPMQARDWISAMNSAHSIQKYSEPAAREELENRIRRIARSIGAGAQTQ
jgi:truncated hemoglobin YjbI